MPTILDPNTFCLNKTCYIFKTETPDTPNILTSNELFELLVLLKAVKLVLLFGKSVILASIELF